MLVTLGSGVQTVGLGVELVLESDSFPRFLTFLRCLRLIRFFSMVVEEAARLKNWINLQFYL